VGLTLILGYVVPDAARPPPFVIFVTALLSISPIAYYIGMAVARSLPLLARFAHTHV
jgi:Ca2+/H+ antiporter